MSDEPYNMKNDRFIVEVQEASGPDDFDWVEVESYDEWEMAVTKLEEFEGKCPARLMKWSEMGGLEKLYEFN